MSGRFGAIVQTIKTLCLKFSAIVNVVVGLAVNVLVFQSWNSFGSNSCSSLGTWLLLSGVVGFGITIAGAVTFLLSLITPKRDEKNLLLYEDSGEIPDDPREKIDLYEEDPIMAPPEQQEAFAKPKQFFGSIALFGSLFQVAWIVLGHLFLYNSDVTTCHPNLRGFVGTYLVIWDVCCGLFVYQRIRGR
eukprot:TRINITY_DN13275_c0_g1_i4.p1 TRINITY_DN13275_c0_g1~~TRINITY_DN13275_c0_g1_i4.p1  ORF type:complete len:189 (-),score=43.04 TRINITY_DN13275_c0_g1_i4:73-639(-)